MKKSFYFDKQSLIQVPKTYLNAGRSGAFVTQFWIKPETFDTKQFIFDSKSINTESSVGLFIDTDGYLNIKGKTSKKLPIKLNLNTWQNICINVPNWQDSISEVKSFYNGEVSNKNVSYYRSSEFDDSSGQFAVIGSDFNNNNKFQGYLDEFRFWYQEVDVNENFVKKYMYRTLPDEETSDIDFYCSFDNYDGDSVYIKRKGSSLTVDIIGNKNAVENDSLFKLKTLIKKDDKYHSYDYDQEKWVDLGLNIDKLKFLNYGLEKLSDLFKWQDGFSLDSNISFAENTIRDVFVGENKIYLASLDSNVYIVDKNDGGLLNKISSTEGYLTSIHVDSNNIYIGGDSKLYIYDKNDYSLITLIQNFNNYVNTIVTDESYIYAGSDDTNTYIFDKEDMSMYARLDNSLSSINKIVKYNDKIYIASSDNKVYIYNNFNLENTINPDGSNVNSIFIDDYYIYLATFNGNIFIYHLDSLEQHKKLDPSKSSLLSINSDKYHLYASNNNNEVFIYSKPDFLFEETITQNGFTYSLENDDFYLYASEGKYVKKYYKPEVSPIKRFGFKNFSLISWTPYRESERSVENKSLPIGQLVMPKEDIMLNKISNIKNIDIDFKKFRNGKIKLIVSKDEGNIWYSYDSSKDNPWKVVNKNDIKNVGIKIQNFNNIPSSNWNNFLHDSSTVRFAYYLEVDYISDIAETNDITLNVDIAGKWDDADHMVDYHYKYPYNTALIVELLKEGSYKINY